MTQERGPLEPQQPNRPNRPELGLSIFQPQTARPEIDLYRGIPDLDQKALVLNRQIVQVEGVTATPSSVRTVAIIAAEQHRGMTQYRSDAVAGLDPENLVAMVNGLAAGETEFIDPVSGAIRRIQQAEERSTFREVGLNPQAPEIKDEEMEALEEEVMGELAERLNEDRLDYNERQRLINSIGEMVSQQALRRISRRGDVLGAFIRASSEFSNEDLRNVLERLQEEHDL